MKKVIILDFDGIFYSGKDIFCKMDDFVNKNKRKILGNLTDTQYKKICRENPDWVTVGSGMPVVQVLYNLKFKYPELKIGPRNFWTWQNRTLDPLYLENAKIMSQDVIERLSKKYPIYVVSNSSPKHLNYFLKQFGINKKYFKKIISNKFTIKDITKKHYYIDIMNKEKCQPKDIYVYGDTYANDIVPALELGMNAFHVTDVDKCEKLLNEL